MNNQYLTDEQRVLVAKMEYQLLTPGQPTPSDDPLQGFVRSHSR